MKQKSLIIYGSIAIALVVGLAIGYFVGMNQGVVKEKLAQKNLDKQALIDATKNLNPFANAITNPYAKAPVNPYAKIQINPFK
jgi:uncharacterized membrane-anchored protein YhcB (DUF1043 family)